MLQAIETTAQVQSIPVLNDFRELPIYALQESPTNPRRSFDEAKLFELAQSIRSQGVLVPLIVRELDWTASRLWLERDASGPLDWPNSSPFPCELFISPTLRFSNTS